MIITQIDNKLQKLSSDNGKSLYDNREYEEQEIPYYFKEAFLPLTMTMEDCLERYLEILDEDMIVEVIEEEEV